MKHAGVCKKTLLRKIIHTGISAVRSPNQGLDCSFCRWIAGHGLAEKERFSFTDTGVSPLRGLGPRRGSRRRRLRQRGADRHDERRKVGLRWYIYGQPPCQDSGLQRVWHKISRFVSRNRDSRILSTKVLSAKMAVRNWATRQVALQRQLAGGGLHYTILYTIIWHTKF